MSKLCTTGNRCNLCDLIHSAVERYNSDSQDMRIARIGSALIIEHNAKRILRICQDLGPSEGLNDQTQISFPFLPAAEGPLRFALLRAWLQRCDKHGCCNNKPREVFPTTLIDVGDLSSLDYNPDVLKLVSGGPDTGKYIALSHCWGELQPNEVPQYCTTPQNISDRRLGFSIANLPLKFQDAVKVTRGLELQYLWIDSLCIIQGKDGDWEQESKRMQSVYTSAYCTVAATSAKDSTTGFLRRGVDSECVCVQDDLGQIVYVCTSIADFHGEVENALLNTRAWVMQERFLSCRTIHFGAVNMYWECGKGVYCEDLTQLTCLEGKTKHFKLDPEFPKLLVKSGFSGTMYFLESLLADYSNRGLSKTTDRAVALSGLMVRIAGALHCQERHGIFRLYLHRNLLWRRRSDEPMTRIDYETRKVPSWSWMAYTGGIDFIEVRFSELEVFKNLDFAKGDEKALITDLWEFKDCYLKEAEANSEAISRKILDFGRMEIGWIKYDVGDGKDLCLEWSIVVGRSTRNYHTLVVRQVAENEYERAGVGMIQQSYVSRQRFDVRIV